MLQKKKTVTTGLFISAILMRIHNMCIDVILKISHHNRYIRMLSLNMPIVYNRPQYFPYMRLLLLLKTTIKSSLLDFHGQHNYGVR